jgi:phosphonate transport system substrate-binding protein
MDRRGFISSIGAAAGLALAMPATMRALAPIRLGLTPVFLDNDAEVITRLKASLGQGTRLEIELIQRRTYQEVTGLLLEGGADAARLCGFPNL